MLPKVTIGSAGQEASCLKILRQGNRDKQQTKSWIQKVSVLTGLAIGVKINTKEEII